MAGAAAEPEHAAGEQRRPRAEVVEHPGYVVELVAHVIKLAAGALLAADQLGLAPAKFGSTLHGHAGPSAGNRFDRAPKQPRPAGVRVHAPPPQQQSEWSGFAHKRERSSTLAERQTFAQCASRGQRSVTTLAVTDHRSPTSAKAQRRKSAAIADKKVQYDQAVLHHRSPTSVSECEGKSVTIQPGPKGLTGGQSVRPSLADQRERTAQKVAKHRDKAGVTIQR